MSEVKTPISGILCRGVVKSISPEVSFVLKIIFVSGYFFLIPQRLQLLEALQEILFLEMIVNSFIITNPYKQLYYYNPLKFKYLV